MLLSRQLIALYGEIYKGLLLIKNRKASNFFIALQAFLLFVGFMFFVSYGKLNPEKIAIALVGYIVLYYVDMLIVQTGWNFLKESQSGTIEQLFMSPAPASLIIFGRTIAILIAYTLLLIPIAFAISLSLYFASVPFPTIFNPAQGLIVLCITFIGLQGFAYTIVSAVIIFKNLEGAIGLMRRFIMFFNGSIVPITYMPKKLATISTILPSTQGIVVLRKIVLNGNTLGATLNDGSLLILCVHSILYLIIGLFIFRATERHVKMKGTLGHY